MTSLPRILPIFLSACLYAPFLHGAEFHVNGATGADTNRGSAEAPMKTLQAAAAMALDYRPNRMADPRMVGNAWALLTDSCLIQFTFRFEALT
jgi:hypothetical protein